MSELFEAGALRCPKIRNTKAEPLRGSFLFAVGLEGAELCRTGRGVSG